MEIKIPIQISQEEALQKLAAFLEQKKLEYAGRLEAVSILWEKNVCAISARAKGYDVSGSITVNKTDVVITADLPFAARIFQGRIESAIMYYLGEALRPAQQKQRQTTSILEDLPEDRFGIVPCLRDAEKVFRQAERTGASLHQAWDAFFPPEPPRAQLPSSGSGSKMVLAALLTLCFIPFGGSSGNC